MQEDSPHESITEVLEAKNSYLLRKYYHTQLVRGDIQAPEKEEVVTV